MADRSDRISALIAEMSEGFEESVSELNDDEFKKAKEIATELEEDVSSMTPQELHDTKPYILAKLEQIHEVMEGEE